jgi:tetratricopeptide (TPR) repeat protein
MKPTSSSHVKVRSGAALLVFALSWCGLPGVALAQVTDDERAQAHFRAGSSYFDQRRFVDAAEQFEEAYRLSGRLPLLLNVATSYERAGRPGDAADALGTWLELAGAEAPDRRTQEARLEQLRIAQNELAAREAAVSQAAPVDESEASDGGLGTLGVVGVALLGTGAATGIVSLGTGVAANAREEELRDGCTSARVCPASLEATRDRGRALARASTVTTFVAIATLGTGAALLLVDLLGGDEDALAATTARGRTVRAAGGPGQAGIGMRLTF